MEGLNLQTLTESGAIGFSILCLIIIWKMYKTNNESIDKHFDRFTEAINNNTAVIGETKQAIIQNSKLMSRVQDKLNK